MSSPDELVWTNATMSRRDHAGSCWSAGPAVSGSSPMPSAPTTWIELASPGRPRRVGPEELGRGDLTSAGAVRVEDPDPAADHGKLAGQRDPPPLGRPCRVGDEALAQEPARAPSRPQVDRRLPGALAHERDRPVVAGVRGAGRRREREEGQEDGECETGGHVKPGTRAPPRRSAASPNAYPEALAWLNATAERMRAAKACSSTSSPSCTSMARRLLPSRLALNRPDGSSRAAPWRKVSLTAFL
jgi:hypothetical protein